MPKSIPELRQQLSAIEPDEGTYEGIGPSEVELLNQLLEDDEAWLAARAVHALSRINADAARHAIAEAAADPRMEVRISVAASAETLPPDLSDDLLARLLHDPHIGVRKFAIKAVTHRNNEAIRRDVREIATTDPNPGLRRIAAAKAAEVSTP